MTRLIKDQNDPDKIIQSIEAMVNCWTLEELKDFVIENLTEYYLGKSVSEDEVEQLINEYGQVKK